MQAEEYLTKANWSILKTPDCDRMLVSELNRNYGRLYLTKGNMRKASEHLARDVCWRQIKPQSIPALFIFSFSWRIDLRGLQRLPSAAYGRGWRLFSYGSGV